MAGSWKSSTLVAADWTRAFGPLLELFGNAKTVANANAPRRKHCLQLVFDNRSRIAAAKVLAYDLDKPRLNLQGTDSPQLPSLLAGATPRERDFWGSITSS